MTYTQNNYNKFHKLNVPQPLKLKESRRKISEKIRQESYKKWNSIKKKFIEIYADRVKKGEEKEDVLTFLCGKVLTTKDNTKNYIEKDYNFYPNFNIKGIIKDKEQEERKHNKTFGYAEQEGNKTVYLKYKNANEGKYKFHSFFESDN